MSNSLKKDIISGTVWSAGGQFITLSILLATNIWLARILSPTEFGKIGIVMFFITIANVFTEAGFGGALIRKKDITTVDYSTAFIFNLFVSICCFLLLSFFSGYIADFYGDKSLRKLLTVSGLVLIINAFQITQNAKIIRELQFKKKTILHLISVILGATTGIISAYAGMGVWALILMQLTTSSSLTILYWISAGVFFKIQFSKEAFKSLYSFGVNTTLASLLNTAFENIYQLILGRYFSINQVGYYYQAKKLQDVPGGIINMVTQSVVFSSLAKLQHDKKGFSEVYNKITLVFLVILGFISCLVYIYAEQIILLLYGDKWLSAAYYMQLLTIASFFYLQEQINRVIFKVFNQTKKIISLEILKKGIQSITIVIGVIYLDIHFLIWGFVVTSVIGYFINYYYSRKILGGDSFSELITILKVIFIAIINVIIVVCINNTIGGSTYYKLATIPLLVILYWGSLRILKVFNLISHIKHIFP